MAKKKNKPDFSRPKEEVLEEKRQEVEKRQQHTHSSASQRVFQTERAWTKAYERLPVRELLD